MTNRILVVDDEALSREGILHTLRNIFKTSKMNPEIYEASNTIEAEDQIKKLKPDIVLLDIEMPNETGIEFLARQKSIKYEVIIITAYQEYAVEAFRYHAQDYLLKPIEESQLKIALERSYQIKRTKAKARRYTYIKEMLQNQKSKKLAIPIQSGIQMIDMDTITFIKASGSYTDIFYDGKKISISKNIKHLENTLPPAQFIRVHDSYIVNKNKIVKYVKGSGGYVVLDDGSSVDVSKRKKEDLLNKLYL